MPKRPGQRRPETTSSRTGRGTTSSIPQPSAPGHGRPSSRAVPRSARRFGVSYSPSCPPRSVRSAVELYCAGRETQARGGDEKGCRRLLPVTRNTWLIFSAEPRNWLLASISMLRIYSVETAGSRRKATARVSLGPYLPRSNPSLLPSQRTLQNPHLNDKPVPLEELNRCAARYGKKGTAPGQSA